MLICHTAMLILFSLAGIFYVAEIWMAMFICLILIGLVFNMTMGAVVFLYAAEICVDKAQGVAHFGGASTAVLMAVTCSWMISYLGIEGTFFAYAGL